MSRILIIHSDAAVARTLSEVVSESDVEWVPTMVAATEGGLADRFHLVYVEHPLAGVPASESVRALRDWRATAPIVVIAAGLTADACADLRRALGSSVFVFPSVGDSVGPLARMEGKESPSKPPVEIERWSDVEPAREPDESGEVRSAPELLLELKRRGETGTLFVHGHGWTLQLDLALGSPVAASGGPAAGDEGDILEDLGYIDSAQRAALRERYETERRTVPIIELAMRMGYLNTTQVLSVLWAQIERKILATLDLATGSYRFYRDAGPLDLPRAEHVALEFLIAEHLRRQADLSERLTRSFIEELGGERMEVTARATEVMPLFRLGGRVQRLLRELETGTLDEVIGASNMPRDEAQLALFLLWAAGAIRKR